VSALLIWYLLRSHDFGAVLRHLGDISVGSVSLALIVLSVTVILVSLRWMLILHSAGAHLPFGPVLHIVFIGLFFNQVLPATVGGDAVRTWRLYKTGVALGASFRSVVLDRVTAFVGLVILVALGLPFVSAITSDAAAFWSLAAVVVSAVGGVALLLSLDRIPLPWRRRGPLRALDELAVDARRFFFTPRLAVSGLGLAVAVHTVSAMTVLILARGMGLEIGALDCLILVPPVMLVSVLPISMAGWGVREGAMIAALGLAGVSSTDALVLSLVFGLVAMVMGLPGGALWFIPSRALDADDSTGS
jgi:uncharacterized membrane protein YbhN (UPF0104 family)